MAIYLVQWFIGSMVSPKEDKMPELGYLEAINQALHEEMARDPSVFMAGIDIAERGDVFGATQGIYSKYGKERIMDTPIAESGIIGLAIGSAARGLSSLVTALFRYVIHAPVVPPADCSSLRTLRALRWRG